MSPTIDQPGKLPDDRPGTGRLVLHFAAGFVATQLVCALGLVMFLVGLGAVESLSSARFPVKVAITLAVGVLLLAASGGSIALRRRFPLFLPGAIVGMVLGMMALGPCAFCFLAMDV